MTEPLINTVGITLLAALLAGLGGLIMFYMYGRRASARLLAEENLALMRRVFELEKQQALLSQAVVPISLAFQTILVKNLTHFHTPEMDALLAKLGPPFVLTEPEEARLIKLLEERRVDMNGRIDDGERDAAQMLPMVMKRVRSEQEKSGVTREPLVTILVPARGES